MNLNKIISNAMKIVDKTTDSLQDSVRHYPWIGNDTYNAPQYAVYTIRKGIVEEKEYSRRMPSGEEILQKASVTFPRPIAPQGAEGRREPIDPRDKIVLPSGYTGPILGVFGVVDPETHQPYSFEVVLG